ncbi:hypothetical protein [Serratia marcescens]|uniref:Uncharacterized protein n=1 Tax=Serratia marcescens TaxID=615 RepID=A0ABD5IER2_SERMA|nr:hypothetical protein [Serratia marcescens]MDX7082519.1 hypothetical protein [Serratia marcescens]
MTQTLTTDELRQIVESDHTQCGDAAAMARELLANREAQPVSGECNREVYENGKSACLVAIPKETAEVICRGISEATGCKVDWHYIGGRVHIKALAPPAPAVPGYISTRQEIANMERHELCGSINVAYKHGWNDFRAAMLAQPVSQGYKLNSPEIPDGWRLVPIDATRAMIEAAQMVEEDGYDAMHKAMLAAAPEGGNEK